ILLDAIFANSEGTVKAYFYKCRQFLSWLESQGIPLMLPISKEVLVIYLSHTKSHSDSDSVLISTAALLRWLHSLVNIKSNPLDSPIIQHVIVSGRRELHHPPVQKQPISLSQVKAIIDLFAGPEASLLELRSACYVSLKYALLFRHNEMAGVKANHLSEPANKKGISIFIPKSKTDVFRDGSTAFLCDRLDNYSPVAILRRFLEAAGINLGQDKYLYKIGADRPLSYTRCRELFFEALRRIGVSDPNVYGTSSQSKIRRGFPPS
ncbi:uncharacterized protein LOC119735134, partial [Patiria miniata]|uniref:Uncharacterized protein n=1 Tax=Patiria miniata TaxID=46514 RepID=A0A914AML9_PATMI